MTFRERFAYSGRVIISHCLFYLGILHLMQKIVLRRKAVVLMYHRVLSADEQRRTGSHPALVVNSLTFAMQMAVLRCRFNVMTMDQFADRMMRRVPFEPSSCVITFDDGWLDNFTNALPVLREHRLSATIFLPVNYIGRCRLFPREALTHLLVRTVFEVQKNPSCVSRFSELLAPVGLVDVLDLQESNPRSSIIAAVGSRRYMSVPSVERLVGALAFELGIELDELGDADKFVDWDQVDAMSRENVAFGGHGAEHRVLTQVPEDVVDTEIRESKAMMDSRFGDVVPTFSYPGGGWNLEVADRVKNSGYYLAFTTDAGHVDCNDNPFALRRLNIHEGVTDSKAMFLARLVGLF